MRTLIRFLADESGATAIEYALIASGIALATLVTVQSLGSAIGNVFNKGSTALQ